MPPASPPSDQQETVDEHSPLSDEDVGILYQIITGAEQDSNVGGQPFRAIFTSYDTVLAQHGLNPDHDQIYLRFLLRLGGNRQAGGTLYDSFEALLAELGIKIEVNTDQNEIQDVTRSVNATARNSPEPRARSEAGSDSGPFSRRASLQPSANERGEADTITRLRSSSRASISEFRANQVTETRLRPSTRASTRPTERIERRSVSRHPAPQAARGRLTAREFASNLQHVQRRHVSASATRTSNRRDRNHPQRHSRVQSNQLPLVQQAEGLSSSNYDFHDFTQVLEQHENRHDPQGRSPIRAYQADDRELFYRPTETQLLSDADDFQHFRTRALARNAMRRWHNIALESQKQHQQMSNAALDHDLGILLRQSFDHWRAVLQLRRQAIATERFFVQLEQRAHKARDLYLLTKAFTHWQQITSDRINHAVEARRHVLSIKYFNAWLELTVVNHRKVQLHGERKFYNVWTQRRLTLLKMADQASSARHRDLIKTAYWKWFWAFCERRAPQWRERRLQCTVFEHWSFLVHRVLHRQYEVVVQRDESVKKAWFSKWLQQARSVLFNARKADRFHQQTMKTRSIVAYRRTTKLTPLARQVSNMADWRIAGATFALLVNRLRTVKQAEKVNQLRVSRNSWTAWNDRLRWQTLEARIDDRVIVQALYKWVLAERCVLLQRLCEQRSMHLFLRRLVDQYRTRIYTQQATLDDFEEKRRTRMSKLIINHWHQSVQDFDRKAHLALDFEAPRITRVARGVMFAWTERRDHIRELDKWAVDARYYFCAVRFLRRWRAATAEAKRRKYRDAYAHIRRRIKMGLASNCLDIWRERIQDINRMQEDARSNDQRLLLQYGTNLFYYWRYRHDFLMDRQDRTLLEFDQQLALDQLDCWKAKYRTQVLLQESGRVLLGKRLSTIASSWLHELQLRVIELKGRESNVELFRRRSEKRHVRSCLSQWREALARQQDQQATMKREERMDPDGGLDPGEWIPGSMARASGTPLAAYLSTPSRRAARAKEFLDTSTTPAGTPSLAAQLRAQSARTPRSVRKSEFGRSNVGFGGSAIGPIQETPRTP
ncbi:MAG: hypothetical protein Q9213_004080 [Squamulea squamosa]